MYELLAPPTNNSAGGLAIPQWRRVQEGLQRNIVRVQDYYRNNPRSLAGGHFLTKLLRSLNISHQLDDETFVWKVSDWADDLSMTMKMTSSIFRGKLFRPGVFYGPDVGEAIVASIEPFDVDVAVKNWQAIEPIRVLTHPFCDFDLALPLGQSRSSGGGLAVIVIDIPKLALQYKVWRRWERSVNHDSPQSYMQFLRALPIPNMLTSHTNVAILNRIMNCFFGGDVPKSDPAHSFYLTNWGPEVDNVAKYYLNHVANKNVRFDVLVDLMPTLGGSMHDVIRLPKQAYSLQLQWAIVLARLVLTTFLVQFNADCENPSNQKYLNYLRRYLRLIEINRGLEHALPQQDFLDVSQIIDDGIRPYL